jgi:hypothetical protein
VSLFLRYQSKYTKEVLMAKRKCKNEKWHHFFDIDPQHPNQQYCSSKECQKARKAKWQREKLSTDEHYKENQADCIKRWKEKNPNYFKQYRKNNLEYTKRNRKKQRERNFRKRVPKLLQSTSKPIAKMDVVIPKISGKYLLTPINDQVIAKMDAVMVELSVITDSYGQNHFDCKR